MTKAELVERVADAVGPSVTKRECALMVDAFLDAVKDTLSRVTASSSGASAPSRCGTARPARAAIPEPERRSRFRPVTCRCSSRQGTFAAGWPEGCGVSVTGEALGATGRP